MSTIKIIFVLERDRASHRYELGVDFNSWIFGRWVFNSKGKKKKKKKKKNFIYYILAYPN